MITVLLFTGGCLQTQSLKAQGNLLVTPMRVVFDGKQKIQELNLANTGVDTARYVISFIEIRMQENGTFEQISLADSGQRFASPYVRFFPRSVVLPPGEAQLVKLQLYNTSELESGEYRSHLYLRAEPDPSTLGDTEEKGAASDSGISIRLTPVFGLSLPVIIRTGEQQSDVSLDSLHLSKATAAPQLHVLFRRTGNISVYGHVRVDHLSPQGKRTQVAEIKGVAVYTPTPQRKLMVPLAKGPDYRTGKLEVTYVPAQNKSDIPMARAALTLRP